MNCEIRLKKERENREWTQNDLAQKMGVSPQTICDWEKGRSFPRKQSLINLERLFGLNYRQLFAVTVDDDSFSSTN